MSTLYINVLVLFEVRWDLKWFLRPWKHLFAAKIRVWISSLMSLLQLTSDPKCVSLYLSVFLNDEVKTKNPNSKLEERGTSPSKNDTLLACTTWIRHTEIKSTE
jgi:hypothetical protein